MSPPSPLIYLIVSYKINRPFLIFNASINLIDFKLIRILLSLLISLLFVWFLIIPLNYAYFIGNFTTDFDEYIIFFCLSLITMIYRQYHLVALQRRGIFNVDKLTTKIPRIYDINKVTLLNQYLFDTKRNLIPRWWFESIEFDVKLIYKKS
jgi:hypothetical protein